MNRNLALALTLLGAAACDSPQATQCKQLSASLDTLSAASADYSDIPDSQDLYVRAAKLSRSIDQRDVKDIELGMLQKILDDPNDPINHSANARASLQKGLGVNQDRRSQLQTAIDSQRAEAMTMGYDVLGTDDGAQRVISAVYWRQVSTHAASIKSTCSTKADSLGKDDVSDFVAGASVASDEHGVVSSEIINDLLSGSGGGQ
jgi:hypothetical protein